MGTNTQLKELPFPVQQQIRWLHVKAFGDSEDTPCKPCGGGCCKGCAGSHGYQSDANFERLKKLYHFDSFPKGWNYGDPVPKGFLTDKGCALPMEERSRTCISFQCSTGHHQRPTEAQRQAHTKATGEYHMPWPSTFTKEQREAAWAIFDLMNPERATP